MNRRRKGTTHVKTTSRMDAYNAPTANCRLADSNVQPRVLHRLYTALSIPRPWRTRWSWARRRSSVVRRSIQQSVRWWRASSRYAPRRDRRLRSGAAAAWRASNSPRSQRSRGGGLGHQPIAPAASRAPPARSRCCLLQIHARRAFAYRASPTPRERQRRSRAQPSPRSYFSPAHAENASRLQLRPLTLVARRLEVRARQPLTTHPEAPGENRDRLSSRTAPPGRDPVRTTSQRAGAAKCREASAHRPSRLEA